MSYRNDRPALSRRGEVHGGRERLATNLLFFFFLPSFFVFGEAQRSIRPDELSVLGGRTAAGSPSGRGFRPDGAVFVPDRNECLHSLAAVTKGTPAAHKNCAFSKVLLGYGVGVKMKSFLSRLPAAVHLGHYVPSYRA